MWFASLEMLPLILTPITPADYGQEQVAPEIIYKQIAEDLLEAINAKDSEGSYSLPTSSLQLDAADKGRVTRLLPNHYWQESGCITQAIINKISYRK